MDRDSIQSQANALADSARTQLTALETAYWTAHKALAETSYRTSRDQREAMRKLSQLGLAVHEAGKAYSAISLVRCN